MFTKAPKNPENEENGYNLDYLPTALQKMVPELTEQDLELPKGTPLVVILARSAERVIAISKYLPVPRTSDASQGIILARYSCTHYDTLCQTPKAGRAVEESPTDSDENRRHHTLSFKPTGMKSLCHYVNPDRSQTTPCPWRKPSSSYSTWNKM